MPDHSRYPWGQGLVRVDTYSPFLPANRIIFPPDHPYFVSIEELTNTREGTPFNANGPREYVRKFRVIVKDQTLGPEAVCQCKGVPLPYSGYVPLRAQETDLKAVVVRLQAAQELHDDWQPWIVTASYSTQVPRGGPPAFNTNPHRLPHEDRGVQNEPWLEPAYVEYDSESYMEAPNQDLDGKAYVNSAEQPFHPGFTYTQGYRVLVIVRNHRDPEGEDNTEKFAYVVNDKTFKKAPAGYALCLPPRAQEMYLGETRYWQLHYRIIMKKQITLPGGEVSAGWQPRILDAGMYERDTLWGFPVDKTLVPIFKFGHAVSQPVLLNGLGLEQTAKYPLGHALAGRLIPKWINFRQFPAVDFDPLLMGK